MQGAFKVGDWLVDPTLNELSAPNHEPVRLEGKVIEVLVCLADHPRHVVPKEEIIKTVWPDTYVSDDALFRCIRELRKLFKDNPRDPQFIETIPKRGYRLIADVKDDDSSQSSSPYGSKETKPDWIPSLKWVVPALLLVIAASVLLWQLYPAAPTVRTPTTTDSVAVLPFINVTQDPELDYLSMGITDSIAFGLSQIDGLKVISNMSSMQYRGAAGVDPTRVSRDLGVRTLLMGRLSTRGNELMISAELVDGIENRLLWGNTFRGQPDQILNLEESVAHAVTDRLQLEMRGDSRNSLDRFRADNIQAYHLYLKGRFHWSRTTADDCLKAIEYYNHALEIEPDYALAYSGLADAYSTMGFFDFMETRNALTRAKEAAQKAIDLDGSLAEAHTSLAGVIMVNDWNWSESQIHFASALRLNPNYDTTHHWLAVFDLAPRGKFAEAIDELQLAQQLKPTSLRVNNGLGYLHYVAGDYENAVEQFQFTIDINPSYPYPYYYLALTYLEKNDLKRAFFYMNRAIDLSDGASFAVAGLAYLLAVRGQIEEAEELVDQLKKERDRNRVSPFDLAAAYAAMNRSEEVIYWLKIAWEERNFKLLYAHIDPRFKNLKNDPRLLEFHHKIFDTGAGANPDS